MFVAVPAIYLEGLSLCMPVGSKARAYKPQRACNILPREADWSGMAARPSGLPTRRPTQKLSPRRITGQRPGWPPRRPPGQRPTRRITGQRPPWRPPGQAATAHHRPKAGLATAATAWPKAATAQHQPKAGLATSDEEHVVHNLCQVLLQLLLCTVRQWS